MAVVLIAVGSTAYVVVDREEAENQRRVLAAAREFRISDLSHPTFAEKIYRFFGLTLSWAEEAAEGERRMASMSRMCRASRADRVRHTEGDWIWKENYSK